MPIANKYDIEEVIDACKYYFSKTGRRVTFEYSLVAGVNDTKEDAEELSRLIHGMNCHVNLIPVNPIKERNYKQPDHTATEKFKIELEKNAKTYYDDMVKKGTELLAEMKALATTVELEDDATQIKYRMGISNGTLYFEEITKEASE